MKEKTVKTVVICAVCVLLAACDMFEYHPYSTHIDGKTGLHSLYIPMIEQLCSGKEIVRFAVVTDTQGSYNELENAVSLIRQRGDIDFIIHGGDQSDFGLPKEFVWCRDIMEKSCLPYVSVIGNHDCLGNGEHTFEYIYGNSNFSFNAGFVHFLCLNTVALEYDYSNPVPDLAFIENDRRNVEDINAGHPDSIVRTICVMHSRPLDEQFNNNVAKVFDNYLTYFPQTFCINGHNHRHEVFNAFDTGILYYGCENMHARTFYIFTVTKEEYSYEKIDF